MLNQWKECLTNLIYPPRCPACGASAARRGEWCSSCLAAIWHPRMINRTATIRSLDRCYCLTEYRGSVRRILHHLKYKGDLRYVPACQFLLGKFPWMDRLQHLDCAIPVPLEPEKEQKRGFNQTEIIFRSWAETHWRWCQGLQRVRPTPAQWHLSKGERAENMKRAFEVKGSFHAAGKQILLVDDIYTTGATLEACAKTLKQNGAAGVTGLVIASGAL